MKHQESLLSSALKYSFNTVTGNFGKLFWYFLAGILFFLLSWLVLLPMQFVVGIAYSIPLGLGLFVRGMTWFAGFYLYVRFTSILPHNLLDLCDGQPFRGLSRQSVRHEVALVEVVRLLCLPLVAFFGLGYYLRLRYSFAYYIALDSDLGVVASLKKSWSLTRGNVGTLFLLDLIHGASTVIPLSLLVSRPFFTMNYVYLYRTLSSAQKASEVEFFDNRF